MARNPAEPTHPSRGSLNSKLAELELGERMFIESDLDSYGQLMSRVSLYSRYPDTMADMRFATRLFTGVSSQAGEVAYLVCIRRIQ